MDFKIDDVRSFFAAMMYIRMFGVLICTDTGESGYISRTFKYGKYTMFIYNNGQGFGMKISILGGKTAYRYYGVTNKDYIRILGVPDNKLEIENY